MEPTTELGEGEFKDSIIQAFYKALGAKQYAKRNPAPLPVSLERKHFDNLMHQDYMVSDKSDGVRYLLFLGQVSGRELSVMIDRKLSVFQVPVAASRSHFKGSVYDGELVRSQQSDAYLIFDCYCHKGVFVGGGDYCSRLSIIRSSFDLEGFQVSSPEEAAAQASKGKIICGGSTMGLRFRPKPCFQLRQLDTLLRKMQTLPYSTDGLIFTPVSARAHFGTSVSLFKYKTHHNIDAEVSSDGVQLLIGVGGAPECAALRRDLCGIDERFSLSLSLRRKMAEHPGCILELSLGTAPAEGGRSPLVLLNFVQMRTDKSHPNTIVTVQRTLVSFEEAITLEELLEVARDASVYQDTRSSRLQ